MPQQPLNELGTTPAKINTEREQRLCSSASPGSGNVCVGSLCRDWKQHTQNQPSSPGAQQGQARNRQEASESPAIPGSARAVSGQSQGQVREGSFSILPEKKNTELEKGNFLQSRVIQRSNQPWDIRVSQSH